MNYSSETFKDKLLGLIRKSLEDDKAQDIVVINLKKKANFTDYLVIASGTSQRQVASMAQHLREKLKNVGLANVPIEGSKQNDWVLIDGGDVVINIFRPEIREFYNLEKMWNGELIDSVESGENNIELS